MIHEYLVNNNSSNNNKKPQEQAKDILPFQREILSIIRYTFDYSLGTVKLSSWTHTHHDNTTSPQKTYICFVDILHQDTGETIICQRKRIGNDYRRHIIGQAELCGNSKRKRRESM